jgi:hypothetical protein
VSRSAPGSFACPNGRSERLLVPEARVSVTDPIRLDPVALDVSHHEAPPPGREGLVQRPPT